MHPNLTSRDFFHTTAVTAGLAALSRSAAAAPAAEASEVAILNETHISAELPPGKGS
jgi:hypothetical protein